MIPNTILIILNFIFFLVCVLSWCGSQVRIHNLSTENGQHGGNKRCESFIFLGGCLKAGPGGLPPEKETLNMNQTFIFLRASLIASSLLVNPFFAM